MIIYITFYNLITLMVTSSRSVETTVGVVAPEGEAYVVTDDLITTPAYYSGGNIVLVPEQPGPEYYWDEDTKTWERDLGLATVEKNRLMQESYTYYLERGFYFSTTGLVEDQRRYLANPQGQINITVAATAASLTLDPLSFTHTLRDNNEFPTVFDYDNVLACFAAMQAHSAAVYAELDRIEAIYEEAYTLAETDFEAAVDMINAIEWTYIP